MSTEQPIITVNIVEGKLVVHAAVDSKSLPRLIRTLQAYVDWLPEIEQRIESNRRIARERD